MNEKATLKGDHHLLSLSLSFELRYLHGGGGA